MGTTATPSTSPRRRAGWKRAARLSGAVLVLYLLTAYIVMPAAWKHHERRHASLEGFPRITHTADGIPGDPLNVALVGTKPEVLKIMRAARWYPADPLTLRYSLAIVLDSIFKRQDDSAPVSNLYLWGRKQDLAFEQPVGNNPRHLEGTGDLASVERIPGFHKVLKGRNGGGDPWHTDGALFLGVIATEKMP